MYRVLHITDAADIGGISSVIVNYYRYLDRSKIRFDVALTADRDGQDGKILRQLGSDIHRIPTKSHDMAAFDRALTKLLTDGRYDAIHVHENTTSYVALRIAKKAGIPQRIAHSHTSAPYMSLAGELKRLSGCVLNYHYATTVIGCGTLAGDRVFGRRNMKRSKAMILPNAIETERFAFDPRIRREVRQELGLEGRFAVGVVGRLAPEKNHIYALELLQKLRTRMPQAVLLVVGSGMEENAIRRRIGENHMESCVRLLGKRADAARLYQGFDALLMPSFHEGFPVAAVEAMAAGLPTLLSDTITRELDFGSARYLRLDDEEAWLRTLETIDPNADRIGNGREVRLHGLDIRDTAKCLEALYLSAANRE